MTVKIKCDLCKKNVDGVFPENYFKLVPMGSLRVTCISYDFCEKCYTKLLKFIRGE